MSAVEERMRELGLGLPELRAPIGVYVGSVRVGNLLFVSGHGPVKDGELVFKGKLGVDLDLEQGREAARLVMLNALRTVKEAIGDLDRVKRFVKLLGFVNSGERFTEQPKVIDGASQLIVDIFGERGQHARSAVGMYELPFGISVEIEMIVELFEESSDHT
jgi:enamine deaminase RidA (YjgF/YER057c/UK114 family)